MATMVNGSLIMVMKQLQGKHVFNGSSRNTVFCEAWTVESELIRNSFRNMAGFGSVLG
jgi:hypothetical protein